MCPHLAGPLHPEPGPTGTSRYPAQTWGLWDPHTRGWGQELCRVLGQKGDFVFGFLDDAFHMALHHAQLLHHFSQEI